MGEQVRIGPVLVRMAAKKRGDSSMQAMEQSYSARGDSIGRGYVRLER